MKVIEAKDIEPSKELEEAVEVRNEGRRRAQPVASVAVCLTYIPLLFAAILGRQGWRRCGGLGARGT